MNTPLHRFVLGAGLAAGLLASAVPSAAGCGGSLDLEVLARIAVDGDAAAAREARSSLRSLGPEGFDAFSREHAATLDRFVADLVADPHVDLDDRTRRVLAALDAISGQRDAAAARLYWYTDLDVARAAAAASGKPILSLRHLGRLDEEYSCANSRFLRTAIYADANVSTALREGFVLHWQSVRPVPRVTIDFGDGRSLTKTITGNCCHLVLDAEGRPIDAIPGLYGPAGLLEVLGRARGLHDAITRTPQHRDLLLVAHHANAARDVKAAWISDLHAVGVEDETLPPPAPRPLRWRRPGGDGAVGQRRVFPAAVAAAPIAVSKMGIELAVIAALDTDPMLLEDATESDAWRAIADRHGWASRLDETSRAVVGMKHGARGSRLASCPGEDAAPPIDAPADIGRVISQFESSLALDSVRNEYLLHRVIHDWFAAGAVGDDPAVLTARIYDELFLTPDDDPWLGLLEPDVYEALE